MCLPCALHLCRSPPTYPEAGRTSVMKEMWVASRSADELLLRVELDDQLLLDGHGEVLAVRDRLHCALEALLVQLQPLRDAATVHRLQRLLDAEDLAALLRDLDQAARLDRERGDVDPLAVDGEVTVANQLPRLVARVGEAQT